MNRKSPASPFDHLLGVPAPAAPPTASATLVVAGKRIGTVNEIEPLVVARQSDERDDDDVLEARRLCEEARRARKRAADKRYHSKPGVAERRAAWAAAHPERVRAARQRYIDRNAEAIAISQAAASRRYYQAHLEKSRAAARARYHARKAITQANEGQP